jgi:hypothetical protein
MRELIKECKHCEMEFDANSRYKKKAGGYINECPDCVISLGTESSVRYRGVTTGDGKMACTQILKFDSEADAQAYVQTWNNNSGFNNRRSGGLNDIKFTKVGENAGNSNHKGKAT